MAGRETDQQASEGRLCAVPWGESRACSFRGGLRFHVPQLHTPAYAGPSGDSRCPFPMFITATVLICVCCKALSPHICQPTDIGTWYFKYLKMSLVPLFSTSQLCLLLHSYLVNGIIPSPGLENRMVSITSPSPFLLRANQSHSFLLQLCIFH